MIPTRCRHGVRRFAIALIALVPGSLFAGGEAEMGSSTRGSYLAEQGTIIPADQIIVDNYISRIDYGYPDPDGDFGVTTHIGHRRLSTSGQREVLQIGIQASRRPFEELPPLNLAFAFDASGSMSSPDKIEWVREGFELFIRKLRPTDFVTVIAFSDTPVVLQPAAPLSAVDRDQLVREVGDVRTHGTADLASALETALEQVTPKRQSERVSRIIIISDGIGSSEEVLEVAQRSHDSGVRVTAVGCGADFNLDLMYQISKRGGGSSRFMSDHEKIEEMFSTGLDRMVVPAAFDLDIELEFAQEVRDLRTWGYRHEIAGNRIRYHLSALHNKDYETILVEFGSPKGQQPGSRLLAGLKLSYTDRQGRRRSIAPLQIQTEFAHATLSASGFSDPMVLKGGTILHAAVVLQDIASLYYSAVADQNGQSSLTSPLWQNREAPGAVTLDDLVRLEGQEHSRSVTARKQRCLDLAVGMKGEIENAHLRLSEEPFADELRIFRKYVEILGGELSLHEHVIESLLADPGFRAGAEGQMESQITGLVRELLLALRTRGPGGVLLGGFPSPSGNLTALAREIRAELSEALAAEEGFSLTPDDLPESAYADMRDTEAALELARDAGADYCFTGLVLALEETVTIFARLLDVEAGSALSVAQLVLPRNARAEALLSR